MQTGCVADNVFG